MQGYRSPRWLFGAGSVGGNAQTIWPALFGRRFHGEAPSFDRTRWTTPDTDFVDVDWLRDSGSPDTPLLVLFHGLEGSSGSHYAQAFADWARRHGWRFALPHFRGCSGELNRAPRAYHSGDFEEIGWMLGECRAAHRGPMLAVGVSLGGNALLRWAEEAGETAARTVSAVAAVSSPIDLAAGGHAIGRGFNRQVYTRMFLRSMVPKALRKLGQHPGLFSRERLLAARDLDLYLTLPGAGTARPVRLRQRVHRTAAWLSRHRRLLAARLGPTAAAPHPHPGAGPERAQRPVRARPQPAAGRRRGHTRALVATGARRPRGLSRRAPARSRADPAR